MSYILVTGNLELSYLRKTKPRNKNGVFVTWQKKALYYVDSTSVAIFICQLPQKGNGAMLPEQKNGIGCGISPKIHQNVYWCVCDLSDESGKRYMENANVVY